MFAIITKKKEENPKSISLTTRVALALIQQRFMGLSGIQLIPITKIPGYKSRRIFSVAKLMKRRTEISELVDNLRY